MNDLTVVGTITIDRLHFRDHTRKSFGGSPWFAIELADTCDLKMGIVTNVGKDFPLKDISKSILDLSKVMVTDNNTTLLDIFPDQMGVPVNVNNFTGEIQPIDLTSKIAIISPLFQEVSINSIKTLRSKFTTMIIDIQGFTRPRFKRDMRLSDDIKAEPKELSQLCRLADIIKFSENEFNVILPQLSLTRKLKTLHDWGLKNIVVTKSDKGCLISVINTRPKLLSIKPISTSDTIGAGDKLLILLGMFLAKNNSFEDSVKKAQRKLQKLIEV